MIYEDQEFKFIENGKEYIFRGDVELVDFNGGFDTIQELKSRDFEYEVTEVEPLNYKIYDSIENYNNEIELNELSEDFKKEIKSWCLSKFSASFEIDLYKQAIED